jgi:hypothetical protein
MLKCYVTERRTNGENVFRLDYHIDVFLSTMYFRGIKDGVFMFYRGSSAARFHVLVTRLGTWIDNWIYLRLVTLAYK